MEVHSVSALCVSFVSDRREREAIAEGLAQRHEVGRRAVRLEAPHVRADASEAGLHLWNAKARSQQCAEGECTVRVVHRVWPWPAPRQRW